jgi:hypothetical protein
MWTVFASTWRRRWRASCPTANWLIPGHAAVVVRPVAGTEMPEASLIHPEVLREMESDPADEGPE